MEPLDSRFIGLLYIILSLLPLPFHLIIITAILRPQKNRNRPPYVILTARAVAEIGQLTIHAMSGICVVANRMFCDNVHVILGHAMFFFWTSMIFLHVLLCINRFVVIAANQCIDKNNMGMTYIFIVVCFIGSAFCTAGSSQDQMRFHAEKLSWTSERHQNFNVAIFYLQIALIGVGLFCCSFVVLFLADQKRKLTQNESAPKPTEIRIFFLSTVTFLIATSNFCLWYPINFIFDNEVHSAMVMNLIWILTCGSPPFLAIWMNSEISRSIRELTFFEPNTTKTVSVVS
ncbi:hypothetical protein M3Y95_01116200 [Aphelenchoides besseyi]|nr:hypothetical protein M3Y95_01116200 [Aphelenchoides besseyi]